MRRPRTPQRDDRGVVAIEFVLILPFLLMLIMGFLVARATSSASRARRRSRSRRGPPGGALPRHAARDATAASRRSSGAPCPARPHPTRSVTVRGHASVELHDSNPPHRHRATEHVDRRGDHAMRRMTNTSRRPRRRHHPRDRHDRRAPARPRRLAIDVEPVQSRRTPRRSTAPTPRRWQWPRTASPRRTARRPATTSTAQTRDQVIRPPRRSPAAAVHGRHHGIDEDVDYGLMLNRERRTVAPAGQRRVGHLNSGNIVPVVSRSAPSRHRHGQRHHVPVGRRHHPARRRRPHAPVGPRSIRLARHRRQRTCSITDHAQLPAEQLIVHGHTGNGDVNAVGLHHPVGLNGTLDAPDLRTPRVAMRHRPRQNNGNGNNNYT